MSVALPLWNGDGCSVSAIPELEPEAFRLELAQALAAGARVGALFGVPDRAEAGTRETVRLYCVLVPAGTGRIEIFLTRVEGSFRSLTSEFPQLHLFEREVYEQCGVLPEGHPWLKPVRKPLAFAKENRDAGDSATFFQVAGEEVHEVAVGPVHAGIIEPGHFRFQCHGERILQVEAALGYQHRGVERALRGEFSPRTLRYAETLAGDTSVGHATACAQALEAFSEADPSPRAHALRAIGLELERLANHTGDLGALAGDAGYLPTASFCGRIRGEFLQLTAQLCGNRFGRGLVRAGGVGFDVDTSVLTGLRTRLDSAFRDVEGAVALLWDAPSVRARFDKVGLVSSELVQSLGLVGPVARASGVARDVRQDLPSGWYRFAQIAPASWPSGDVFARAYLRWTEIRQSVQFLREVMDELPGGPIRNEIGELRPDCLAVSFVEGWRGEIAHVVLTDAQGRIAHYKVVDPSFHNWMGLMIALRGEQISDFPLCNKSFNLSYCGHDL